MIVPNPPTDNLYKFLFIGSLASIIIIGIAIYNMEIETIKEKNEIKRLETEHKLRLTSYRGDSSLFVASLKEFNRYMNKEVATFENGSFIVTPPIDQDQRTKNKYDSVLAEKKRNELTL